MSTTLLLVLIIASFVGVMLSATAAWILKEIAWHELEEFCKIKKQPERFGRIFELREPMQLGAEILQDISTAILAVTATAWLAQERVLMSLSGFEIASIILLLAFVFVLSSSWVPWAVARVADLRFLYSTWRWWWLVSALAWPLMVGGRFVSMLFERASGHPPEPNDEEDAFEDEILSMVSEGEHDGFIESEAADMIEGIMELDDADVRSVMTPRSKVDCMEIETEWEDMLTRVVESGRTRIPVYEKEIDRVIGILYAKDLLRESLRSESKRRPLQRLLRDPLFVPQQTRLDEMLSQFLHGRTHMAIVHDEYGGMAGVVTIEDILEEIVGEIVDETDKDLKQDIEILNPTQADVEGSVYIHRLNETLGLELSEDENVDTVSGLIMNEIQEIPRPGHEVVIGNVQFNIQEANRRQIQSVRVTVLEEERG